MVGVAGSVMAARGLETSTPSRGTFTRRCDSGRLLQQPAGRVERAARPRGGCGGLDLGRDRRAGTARGEREVRSPFLRALESAREPRVCGTALRRRGGSVDSRCDQWMREADSVQFDSDDLRSRRLLERVLDVRLTVRRHEQAHCGTR